MRIPKAQQQQQQQQQFTHLSFLKTISIIIYYSHKIFFFVFPLHFCTYCTLSPFYHSNIIPTCHHYYCYYYYQHHHQFCSHVFKKKSFHKQCSICFFFLFIPFYRSFFFMVHYLVYYLNKLLL
ncbi:hypothetical protein BDA99DRAFT_274109 [Phascolomyces articulosus]|uniref:Uncharacterized protein n=1 Tax=Phascolomyces articulosus TaxID=60185 RepID=A0AAD5KP12_9FUNG|nr:hypothetical protein BDA99DRAFT_274109 [Phascolomyces articulosus]